MGGSSAAVVSGTGASTAGSTRASSTLEDRLFDWILGSLIARAWTCRLPDDRLTSL